MFRKMSLKEIHYKRFIEVVEKLYSKVWTVDKLLEKINYMMPSNTEINKENLIKLITKQQYFKVFRCKSYQERKHKTYYIFRRYLPR